MKSYSKLWGPSGFLVLALAGCGRDSTNEASLKDVASTQMESGTPVYLYWTEGSSLFHGKCQENKPPLRRYCQNQKSYILWVKAEQLLFEDRSTRLAILRADENDLRTELKSIEDRLVLNPGDLDLLREKARVSNELTKTQASLAGLISEVESIKKLIAKLKDQTIVYKIVKVSSSYSDEKPFLDRLDRYFLTPTQPNPVVPATPVSPVWTDFATGISYIAISTPMNRMQAAKACSSISTGQWTLVDASAPNLSTSPILDFIPFAIGVREKWVWTSLETQNHAPYAIRWSFDAMGRANVRSAVTVTPESLIPSICQRR
jgi:hypothetical protein